jgi:hypothetical protein
MAIKLAHAGKLPRAPSLDLLIFFDQKPPLLQVIALNRAVKAVVAHCWTLLSGVPAISELSNLYNCERSEAIQQNRSGLLDCFVACAPRNDGKAPQEVAM